MTIYQVNFKTKKLESKTQVKTDSSVVSHKEPVKMRLTVEQHLRMTGKKLLLDSFFPNFEEMKKNGSFRG